MSVDVDVIGFMEEYSDPLCVCVVHCIGSAFLYSELHTSMSTDTIEPFL